MSSAFAQVVASDDEATRPAAHYTVDELMSRIARFSSHRTGLIGKAVELPLSSGNPAICVYSSPVCDLNALSEAIEYGSDDGLSLSGAGSFTHRAVAQVKAYCEALERYCSVNFNPDELVVATRNELGNEAVDLELFPRGTAREYDRPGSFFVPPDNSARIRWVPGYSLLSGERKWLPAGLVYLSSPYHYPGEAFTVPITTGCALAASYEQAVVSGLCEVIERDALSLTWLQRLALPRIVHSPHVSVELEERIDRVRRAGFEQYFFNATTDLGVSTIYALQVAPSSQVSLLVMAATRLNPIEAMIKVVDEAASSRFALEALLRRPTTFDPNDPYSFTRLTDGALYYADWANHDAFDFLFDSTSQVDLADLPTLTTEDPIERIDWLLDRFRACDLEAYVADLTPPYLRREGLYVVRTIVPALMPLTINHNLRFLATERLYEAPPRMGYPAHALSQINPFPQPFA
ncbi:MAG: YcaO-like family protein [Anaerolineales bacterium]|nr:YcaO-like family protein [Anaerolineales bacterium]MCB9127324.1 YcaO-like family protein [Ardenticatenales bacterium]